MDITHVNKSFWSALIFKSVKESWNQSVWETTVRERCLTNYLMVNWHLLFVIDWGPDSAKLDVNLYNIDKL